MGKDGYLYGSDRQTDRILDGQRIYENNYLYSNIRAYLNGTPNQFITDSGRKTEFDGDWTDKGFLQKAFTKTAQNLIAVTEVDNSEESTNPAGKPTLWNGGKNDYACANTKDKVFLLSVKEATDTSYGFTDDDGYGDGNSRIRVPTDYADVHCAVRTYNNGTWWWTRSPYAEDALDATKTVHYITYEGKAWMRIALNSGSVCVVPALTVTLGE